MILYVLFDNHVPCRGSERPSFFVPNGCIMWNGKSNTVESRKRTQIILRLINTVAKMNDSRVYDVELHSSLVRVYIDNDTDGVNLNLCEKFMKNLLFLLHSEGMEEIECEVSSPGLERKLRKDWHFKSAVGETVRVQTNQPISCYDDRSGQKKQTKALIGQLHKYYNQTIDVNDGSLEWTIPLSIITRANVVFEDKSRKV